MAATNVAPRRPRSASGKTKLPSKRQGKTPSKAVSTARQQIAPKAKPDEIATALMPLDVMLAAMRELWARAEALKGKDEAVDERLALVRQASAEAHKAAVYVHPRLASVDAEGEQAATNSATATTGESDRGLEMLGSRELARRLLFIVASAEQHSDATGAQRPRSGRNGVAGLPGSGET